MSDIVLKLLPEIVVIAFGAGLHHSYEKVQDHLRRKAFEKKYPVSGDYISKYEDESEGKKLMVTAPIKLTQSGHNVRGITEFDGRVWILDGILSEDGYYYGRYYPENRYDNGMGNFFLKVENDGNMSGLWSGYDSANKRITSGSYTFFRLYFPEILPMTKAEIPKALAIGEKQLGDSYIQERDLLGPGVVAFYANLDGQFVGFSACRIVETDEFLAEHPQITTHRIKSLSAAEKIGVLSSVAVEEKAKGHGVGLKLMQACLNSFRSQGIGVVIMTGWKSSKGVHNR